MKLKSLYIAKETITRMKKQPTEKKKIFASYSFNRRSMSRICKELKKLNTKGTK
jgi:hypothetical protein